MKKVYTKIIGILLALTVFLTAIPIQAAAMPAPTVPKQTTITYYPATHNYTTCYGDKINKNKCYLEGFSTFGRKVDKVYSSNPKVVKAAYINSNLVLVAKKPGTATVTTKIKSKTYKTKVTVKKYVNPISSVKIGDTTLTASKFKSNSNYTLRYSKYANKKVKVTVTLAKGWELPKVPFPKLVDGNYEASYAKAYGYFQNGWQKSDPVKNGRSVRISGKKGLYRSNLEITAVNKTTGQKELVYIFFK